MGNFSKNRKVITIFLSVLSLIIGCVWFYRDRGFEPFLFVLSGIVGLLLLEYPILTKKYKLSRLSGRISFDYSNNNGVFILGQDDLLFETKWSKASGSSIHIYNDPPSIESVAVARGIANISDISDASSFDFSSRSRTPEEGDIVILKNKYGKYLAIKIIDIKDCRREDSVDEIIFDYVINPDGATNFR